MGGGVVVGGEDDPFLPLSRQLGHHVVGAALVFPLLHRDAHLFCPGLHQLHGRFGVEHGAEDLPLLPHHQGPQVPLLDIPVRGVEAAALEEDAPGPRLHQILIDEAIHAHVVHQHDPVLRPGDGHRVQPRHVVQLPLHAAAAAAAEPLAGDGLAVGQDLRSLDLPHGDREFLQPGLDPQGGAAAQQVFRRLLLRGGAAAADIVRVVKYAFQLREFHCVLLSQARSR